MRFAKLLARRSSDPFGAPNACIGFLGDSVTQGCFECYQTGPDSMETVFDTENSYSSKLKRLLLEVYPRTPLNLINAGISGDTAPGGLARLERDLLRYSPDLAVVCFGLNDCMTGVGEDAYADALGGIFDKLREAEVETLFMTPNMMATRVDPRLTAPALLEIARKTVETQQSGALSSYLDAARRVCASRGVPVCDCYRRWEKLAADGADVTALLANFLNHPTREMHGLFASELFRAILFEGKN